MRHRKLRRKLGMKSAHRKAMFRNIITSLLKYELIKTTLPKAKDVKKIAEKLITLGKRADLHARRQVLSFVRDKDIVKKLFENIAPRFRDRNGGYTRIYRLGFRHGDSAELALLEIIGRAKKEEKKQEKKGKEQKKGAEK